MFRIVNTDGYGINTKVYFQDSDGALTDVSSSVKSIDVRLHVGQLVEAQMVVMATTDITVDDTNVSKKIVKIGEPVQPEKWDG